jgi:radical SAM-linked protein
VDARLDRKFLLEEFEKSARGEATPDCRVEGCLQCGVCDGKGIAIREAAGEVRAAMPDAAAVRPAAGSPGVARLRLAFAKTGLSRFLSHLEVSSALTRAIKRSGLSLRYSEGFHPHPKVSFAFATAVGMESLEELADIQVEGGIEDTAAVAAAVNAALPEGLEVRRIHRLGAGDPAVAKIVTGFRYRVTLPGGEAAEGLEDRIARFLAAPSFIVEREGKDGTSSKDVRPYVDGISLDRNEGVLEMTLLFTGGKTARPAEILTRALGLDAQTVQRSRLVKAETILSE